MIEDIIRKILHIISEMDGFTFHNLILSWLPCIALLIVSILTYKKTKNIILKRLLFITILLAIYLTLEYTSLIGEIMYYWKIFGDFNWIFELIRTVLSLIIVIGFYYCIVSLSKINKKINIVIAVIILAIYGALMVYTFCVSYGFKLSMGIIFSLIDLLKLLESGLIIATVIIILCKVNKIISKGSLKIFFIIFVILNILCIFVLLVSGDIYIILDLLNYLFKVDGIDKLYDGLFNLRNISSLSDIKHVTLVIVKMLITIIFLIMSIKQIKKDFKYLINKLFLYAFIIIITLSAYYVSSIEFTQDSLIQVYGFNLILIVYSITMFLFSNYRNSSIEDRLLLINDQYNSKYLSKKKYDKMKEEILLDYLKKEK